MIFSKNIISNDIIVLLSTTNKKVNNHIEMSKHVNYASHHALKHSQIPVTSTCCNVPCMETNM